MSKFIDIKGIVNLHFDHDQVQLLNIVGDYQLQLNIDQGVNVKIIAVCGNNNIKGNDDIHLAKDSSFTLGIIGFNQAGYNVDSHIHLDDCGANVLVKSGFVINSDKQLTMTIHHHKADTTSLMEHYGLVTDNFKFVVEGIGKIDKYASGSDCRQALRAATFADKENVKLVPQLLIDEYDVTASHATSIGQISDRQLYYLQSKGLNRGQILYLMAKGYLQPVIDLIDETDIHDQIMAQVESVVSGSCLM